MKTQEENDEENVAKSGSALRDFDDILKHVGGWGPFQYLLVIIFFPFNIFLGYVYLSPILTLFTPTHWCLVPELMNMTREERKHLAIPQDKDGAGGFSQCSQYLMDWSQVPVEDLRSPEDSWPVGDCKAGWEYEVEDYHKSVTVEFDWVCDQAWIPALSQTVFFFGAIPGMLFFGWFSDTFGRLPTIMCSNILALVTGMATPFVTGHFSFLALRLAMGLAFNTFYTAPYILGKHWVSVDTCDTCGLTMLACAWLTDQWKAQAVMFMLGRFFATYSMNLGFQFTVEVMPTDLRGQGTALVNVMSMVSQMASPYIVYSSVISEKAPFLIIGIIAVLGSFPGLYLPETADVNLPDSLEDIEDFGKNDKFFWLPLCGAGSRYKYSQKESLDRGAEMADNQAFTQV